MGFLMFLDGFPILLICCDFRSRTRTKQLKQGTPQTSCCNVCNNMVMSNGHDVCSPCVAKALVHDSEICDPKVYPANQPLEMSLGRLLCHSSLPRRYPSEKNKSSTASTGITAGIPIPRPSLEKTTCHKA